MKATIQTSINSNTHVVTLDGTPAEITEVIKGLDLAYKARPKAQSKKVAKATEATVVEAMKKNISSLGYTYVADNLRSCNRVVNKYPRYVANMSYSQFVSWYKDLFNLGFFTYTSSNKELQGDSLESYHNLALRLAQ
jgi:hypothetical protein